MPAGHRFAVIAVTGCGRCGGTGRLRVDREPAARRGRVGPAESLLCGVTTVARDHHLTWPAAGIDPCPNWPRATIDSAASSGTRAEFLVRGTARDDPRIPGCPVDRGIHDTHLAGAAVGALAARRLLAAGQSARPGGPCGRPRDFHRAGREVATALGLRRRTQASRGRVDVAIAAETVRGTRSYLTYSGWLESGGCRSRTCAQRSPPSEIELLAASQGDGHPRTRLRHPRRAGVSPRSRALLRIRVLPVLGWARAVAAAA